MAIQTQVNQDLIEYDEKKLNLIRQTVCKDATPEEFEVFMEICKATQLSPLFKQIYFIKRGGRPTHQTSIDGLRLIADRSKKYMPGREPTFTYDAKTNALISATSYVKKLASDGSWHEVAATAFNKEFNANVSVWKTMPHIMLSKCAEALALRRAFPADMLGIYTKEEMEQADNETIVMPQEAQPVPTNLLPTPTESVISAEDAFALDRDIRHLIAPVDPEYKERALKVLQRRYPDRVIDSFEKLPISGLESMRINIEKKVEEIRKSEIPVTEEQVPF